MTIGIGSFIKSLNRLLGTLTIETNDSIITGTMILMHSNSHMGTMKKKLLVLSHILQAKETNADVVMILIRTERVTHNTIEVDVALERGFKTRWSLKI